MKKQQIIGSLTTISSRIETIQFVIKSLFKQTMPISKLYLFISKEPYLLDKGIQTIPNNLKFYIDNGFLEIQYVENHGPYRKFIPIMQKFRNKKEILICYFDDDMIYPKMLVEKLYLTYLKFPNSFVSPGVSQLKYYDDGNLQISKNKYHRDKSFYKPNEPRMDLWLSNGWGVMFRADLLNDDELFDKKKYLLLCPKKDEGWLNAILKKNKITVVMVDSKIAKGKGKFTRPGTKWHSKKGRYIPIKQSLEENVSLSSTLNFSYNEWYNTLMGMYDYFKI